MATVRIMNNILEKKIDTFSIESGTVESIIREHTDGNVYDGLMIECYDPETGETFYAPLENSSASSNAIVQVNGKNASLDYEVKDTDIVTIIITPAGGMTQDALNFFGTGQQGDSWNWWGALIGNLAGSLEGFLIGASFGQAAGPMWWIPALIGAAIGGTAGFIVGGIGVGKAVSDARALKDKTSSGGIDSQSLPDVRGATNQPLTDNSYPFVLGKHLVTPFILGSPWNEISGNRGQTNYIHCLYVVGYGPLRLTDFKLGDMYLAHNQRWTGNSELKNIFHGMLRGVDSQSGSGEDKGDIVNTWKVNDISMEILQQDQNGQAVDYGSVYPYAKIQEDIKANVLYIADGSLQDIDNEKTITYKGLGLANGLRNNPVRFSEQYAKSLKVELDFNQGMYKSRSETSGNKSRVKYYRIPLWTAIQWRVYSEDNIKSDGSEAGTDIPMPTWDSVNKVYNPVQIQVGSETKSGDFRGWHSFKTINGNTLSSGVYTAEQRRRDLREHTGNTYSYYRPTDPASYGNYELVLPSTYQYNADYIFEHKSEWTLLSGAEVRTGIENSTGVYDISYHSRDAVVSYTDETGEHTTTTTQYYASFKATAVDPYSYINEGWINSEVFNLEPLGGTNDDPEGINEIRCVTEVDLIEWARENLLTPAEQGNDTILAEKFKAYFYSGSNTTRRIEVRVVRVSPCYLDETVSTDTTSAFKFNDVFTWSTLTSEMLDGDKLIDKNEFIQKRPIPEEKMRKLCVISLKAKTDTVDQLSNTLKKFTCVAEAFQPYYDSDQKKWFPESVHKIKKYYRPSYKDNEGVWHQGDEITEAQFIEDRQSNPQIKSISVNAGNDYIPNLVTNVIRTNEHIDSQGRYFIPYNDKDNHGQYEEGCDGTMNYCENNVASAFVYASIGPHLGNDALGYEQRFTTKATDRGDLNMNELGKWFVWAKEVTDGSTYPSDGFHYDHNGVQQLHKKGDVVKIYFAANAYIYNPETLETILAKISIAGRAIYTRDSKNRITIVIDKPEKYPVALINQQNSLSSSYTISFNETPSGLQIIFPDENDGYQNNVFYCMADGEDSKNPRRAIEQYRFDFVTNNYQQYSLGRYLLANRILNREVVVKKVGIEGASIGLGNLVLVQDSVMLIGTDNGGRITNLIETDTTIYGFVIDNTYHFTGEEEEYEDSNNQTLTRCKQGVIVMQPSQYKESKIVTVRLAKNGTTYNVNGTIYRARKGNTNQVLFDRPISKDPSLQDGTDYYVYRPEVGNLVGFGLIGQITATYRVVKIKPDNKRNFEFTLSKYQEELYQYGRELPSFQNNMTIPDRSEEDHFELSENATNEDIVKAVANATNVANANTIATFSVVPVTPTNFRIVPTRDYLEFSCSFQSQNINNVDHVEYTISRPNGTQTVIKGGSTVRYYFNRTTDGYPEADDFDLWTFTAKTVAMYTDEEGVSPSSPEVSGSISQIDKQKYGTWHIPDITVDKEVLDRTVILTAVHRTNVNLYGTEQIEVKIKRLGNAEEIDGRSFNQMLCIEEDDIFFEPEFNKAVQYKENANYEDNYKKNSANAYISNYPKITHTLPLIGQTLRIFKQGDVPVTKEVMGYVKQSPAGSENPSSEGWYERDGVNFVLTEDVEVIEGKNYFAYAKKQTPVFTKDVPNTSITPTPVRSGDVIRWTGRTTDKFDENGYYLFEGNSDLIVPVGSESPVDLSWYELDDEQYVLSEDTSVDPNKDYYTLEWTRVFSKALMVPTIYLYSIKMRNESGYETNEELIEIEARSTNISDIVHSHEYYKEFYVEKLSAIAADVGMISRGGMGTFDPNKGNYWALSRLEAEECGIPGGVDKGAFRVGGENEYFKVTPDPENPDRYSIELKAGNIELTTSVDSSSEGQGLDFYNGTSVYTSDKKSRLNLTPQGIVVQVLDYIKQKTAGNENPKRLGWYEKVNDTYVLTTDTTVVPNKDYYKYDWDTTAKVLIDSSGNLVLTNSSKAPPFGFQVAGSIYHFDVNPENDESGQNTQSITCVGEIKPTDSYGPILIDSPKCFLGTITKNISSYTGKIVFFSKADGIKVDRILNIDGTITETAETFNSVMKEELNEGTVGSYLGLSATQIETGIFEEIEE